MAVSRSPESCLIGKPCFLTSPKYRSASSLSSNRFSFNSATYRRSHAIQSLTLAIRTVKLTNRTITLNTLNAIRY